MNRTITFKRIPWTYTLSTPGSKLYLQFFSFLLSTDVHSTDTGLEDSTAQMHSSTCSTLCSSTLTISLYSPITNCSPLHATHWLAVTTVCLSAGLKCCLLHFWILLLSSSQRWQPITRSFYSFLIGEVSGIPAPLKSEASWVATLLVAVASATIFYGFSSYWASTGSVPHPVF